MEKNPLESRISEIEKKIEQQEKKDIWDKLSIISSFFSGVIIAAIGIYATSSYNSRQLESNIIHKERELSNQELKTVETFFTHLSSEDQALRKSALDAINSLGFIELAIKLSSNFQGSGAEQFLLELSASSNATTASKSKEALESIKIKKAAKLTKEISYRLSKINNLFENDKINNLVLAELKTVFENTAPSDQNYMVGGNIYYFNEFSSKNLLQILDVYSALTEGRSNVVDAIKAVSRFQFLLMKQESTAEVEIAHGVIDSVPIFTEGQLSEIQKQILPTLQKWVGN